MRKRVGLVTLYKDNFGSILQAYSTYNYIKKMKFDCVILEDESTKYGYGKIKKIFEILCRCIRYKEYFIERKRNRSIWKQEYNLLSYETRRKMEMFVREVFKVEKCNLKNIQLLNSKYDFFITGSDQVWNGYDSFKYLVFADDNKRIALAPSFGTTEVKEYFKENIIEALNGFEILSSREESGVNIIKKLTGRDAVRLPDPTLLLTKDDWIRFSSKGIKKKKYILLHFLNVPNKKAIETINIYLKNNQYSAYCICNRYENYEQLLRYKFIDINPYDYVSLIYNAEFVFTDSYHSTLFSLNLEKQFLTFERQYLHGDSQSSRIRDLLDRIGMKDRYILNDAVVKFEEYGNWRSSLMFKQDRDKLINYIEKVLER